MTQLKIVVKDDNENSESFSIKVPNSIFDLGVYKYLKTAISTMEVVFKRRRSAFNFQHAPMSTMGGSVEFCRPLRDERTRGVDGAFECKATAREEPLYQVSHAYYHVRRILKRMI